MTASAVLLERDLVLSGDARLRISAVADGALASVELRIFRRSPDDTSPDAFHPTGAGLRCPQHLVPELIAHLQRAAIRACEHASAAAIAGKGSP